MVLNISEMEAKVREATNDEPWYVFLQLSLFYCGGRLLTRTLFC